MGNKRKYSPPPLWKDNNFYEFACCGCSAYSVDKNERTFYERTCEHAWIGKGSVINDNLDNLTPLLFSDNDSNNDIDSTSLKTDLV